MKRILQKLIAESGYCSRRAAEDLIRKGQVKLNGVLAKPGDMADDDDNVKVRGQVIGAPREKVYIKMNKPIGYTCTNRQFKGEKNIFELAESLPSGVFTIGRLDKNSRGLILISNDGDLTLKLTHPRHAHEKVYEVKVRSDVTDLSAQKAKEVFIKGVPFNLDEGVAKAKKVDYLGDGFFRVVLAEGKKRQIRRMFEWAGLKVIDLKRVSFAELEIGSLPEGKWGYLNKAEIERLKKLG
jgi:pseudouridine synthase